MMNRTGITFFVSLMIGVCVILLGLAFAPAIKEFNDNSRNQTTWDGAEGLDCTNTSISDSQRAACYSTDIVSATFIGFLIAFGLAAVIGKVMFS